jgi:hypothetical protein
MCAALSVWLDLLHKQAWHSQWAAIKSTQQALCGYQCFMATSVSWLPVFHGPHLRLDTLPDLLRRGCRQGRSAHVCMLV